MDRWREARPADGWSETLSGTGVALSFLSRALYERPTAPFLKGLAAARPLDDWPLGPEEPWVRRGLGLLDGFLARWTPGRLPELARDYDRLFVGPGILAAPWESVYRSEEHLTFDRETLEVRSFYRRFGLEIERLGKEPDDHLGLELAFLAHLASMGRAALERDDEDGLQVSLEGQRSFLHDHLLRWAPDCLERILAHAATDYYRGVACLTRGSLTTLASLLGLQDGGNGRPTEG